MYLTLFLYLILGILFLLFPKTSLGQNYNWKVDKLIKQDCSTNKMKCIDSCDFLCTDSNYKCINNICQLNTPIQCENGVVVLTEFSNVPYWECICTDPSYYGGKECKTLAPDVCKDGIFMYRGLNRHVCKCKNEDVLLIHNQKEYCVSKAITNFFPS